MEIKKLIQEGEDLKYNLNKSNYEKIIDWIRKSQSYVETKYNGIEFTKTFCSTAKSFINIVQSQELYNEEYFTQLISSLKECKEYEAFLYGRTDEIENLDDYIV
ncbi:hypothetical protein PB1_02475 [Bacillus methanolicus PB1]|uniref:Uncharacterized protein n=1 Tax=Bacillus methanolicus PB1 TaxID=997296 RepID=I3E5J7_BACMT|nr:hypothetical protein [Bacillus methanolicus]EIJ81768.1 hypothetical protein PB1_02475 [Bacillus methanolicus PB1]